MRHRWRETSIAISTEKGPRVARGFCSAAFPGLAVSEVRGDRGLWAVTHMPSGHRLPALEWNNRRSARVAVALLSEIACWTQDASTFKHDYDLVLAIHAIGYATGSIHPQCEAA